MKPMLPLKKRTKKVHIRNHSNPLKFLLSIAHCINYMFQHCSLILVMLDLLYFYLLGRSHLMMNLTIFIYIINICSFSIILVKVKKH
jgi:hypothetical protein